MKSFIASLGLGVFAGVLSGLVGVGGGIVIVPALVYFFGMDQKTAQGTSLAVLLPPTGLLAFLGYYRAGHVDLKVGALIVLVCRAAPSHCHQNVDRKVANGLHCSQKFIPGIS